MGLESLKQRELDILRLMAEGLTDAEIAVALHLATGTVRWYNKNLYQKLDVHSRTEAVQYAQSHGLLEATYATDVPSEIPKSPIQYVKSDGLHIAFQVVGDGDIDILFLPGFVSHIEGFWENPEVAQYFERLGTQHRLIMFDRRGMGLSDRTHRPITLEDMMTDACAVMDAAGSHKAIIMGISQGGAATILFAATYPERVQGMVLYGTTPTFVQRNNEPSWAMPEDAYAKWIDNIEREWGGAYGLGVFAPSRLHDPALRDWWAKFLRMAASPGSITSLLKIDAQVDVRHILSSVQVPTLVIHRTQDRAVRIDAGRYLAETIPDATLIELEGNDHFFFVDAEPIIQYIEDFSHSLTNDHSPQNIFATIVYGQSRTALDCDHMMATIKRRNGRLIACADGTCTIVFDRPSHAIRCAQELNHNLENTKFGIHIGECQLRGNSLTGIALDIAQQICQVSNPQTVCVSRTIRDLIAGTGIQLEEMTIQPAGALQLPIYLVHENVS